MTATSGVNDTYRMYVTTKRDGVGFNLAYIDSDFTLPYKGPFDQGYMRALFWHLADICHVALAPRITGCGPKLRGVYEALTMTGVEVWPASGLRRVRSC